MANAAVAREWFLARAAPTSTATSPPPPPTWKAAAAFGIGTTFGFWDWVGGRYSLWSAIGLPIAIAIGAANFRALLAGAHAMDRHFAEAPLPQPTCRCCWACWTSGTATSTASPAAAWRPTTRACAAAGLPAAAGDGKQRQVRGLDGQPLPYGTSPVVWGEPGTNGQHAYFQMLHQGTDVVPVEFIAVARRRTWHADLHTKLLANCLAQSQALMLGKTPPWPRHRKARPRPRPGSTARCWRGTAAFPATGPAPPSCWTR
jgi:glucose-6-phosphate isomerase